MTGSELVPTNGHKHLAASLMEEEEVDTFLEIDLRKYEDQLTRPQARELIRELAYWMLYRADNNKGLPYTHIAAHKIISTEYRWLLDIAELIYRYPVATKAHAERIAKRLWEEDFDGRTKFAAIRFRDRMLQIDRLLPIVENAILIGDLGAVDKFVALARLDMDATGYKAPTKYEFSADARKELTEADKQAASEAIDDARNFEDQLLGNILDGQFEEINEEEIDEEE